ncbi:hypothetical protein GCM10017710_15230 [Arthrobacter ramosus]
MLEGALSAQDFTWPQIELIRERGKVFGVVDAQGCSLWKVLPEQTLGFLRWSQHLASEEWCGGVVVGVSA